VSRRTRPSGVVGQARRALCARTRLGRQFTKFLAVGALNTALSLAAYTALLTVGVPYLIASVCAFTAGALNGYRLNRKWTFRAGPASTAALARYLGVRLGGIAVNSALLVLLVEVAGAGPLLGQLVALPAISTLAFLASRRWVFRAAQPTTW
jgi:putative flippase GtrA